MLVLFVLWEAFTYFVAYTDDAYVRSDLVAVAPEVTGPIIAVHVVDNQAVKKGDKLVTIDPVPFQLDVNQRQAQIDEAAALLKVAQEQLSTAQEALDARHLDPHLCRRAAGTVCRPGGEQQRAARRTRPATTTNCAAPRRR